MDNDPSTIPASILDALETQEASEASETTPTPPDVLPRSGKPYTVRPAKGRDLAAAQDLTKDPNQTTLALVAVTCKVDGQKLTLKDLSVMPLADVTHLIGLVMPSDPQGDAAEDDTDAPQEPTEAPKVLPVSGKPYEVREGLGGDLVKAQRAVRRSSQTTLALVAVLSKVDGKQLVMEDVEEMPLADVMHLIGEAMPEGKA
jgi:hypothetical protein